MISFENWLKLEVGTGSNCVAVVPTPFIGGPITRTYPELKKKRKKFEEWLNEEFPTQATPQSNAANQSMMPNQQIPAQVPPKPSLTPYTLSQPNNTQTQTIVGKGGTNIKNVVNNPKNAKNIIAAVQQPNNFKSQTTLTALQQTLDGTNPNAINAVQ